MINATKLGNTENEMSRNRCLDRAILKKDVLDNLQSAGHFHQINTWEGLFSNNDWLIICNNA